MYKSAVNLGAAGYDPVMYFQDGGTPMDVPDYMPTAPGSVRTGAPEEEYDESGMSSVLWDKITGDDPTKDVRYSGRIDSALADELYGSGPTFMEQLIEKYDYPVMPDPQTGELVIPTEFGSEADRHARPRHDMPTYPELEDARAHMLGSAIMAKEYGPETAASAGTFNEFIDRFGPWPAGGQNARDVEMDQRNNAVGRQIFMKAGINAPVQQLTKMVDAEVFAQLDKIMGRTKAEQFTPAPGQPRAPRNFVSPPEGPDLYFPRNDQGYFDTTRRIMGVSRKYRNY